MKSLLIHRPYFMLFLTICRIVNILAIYLWVSELSKMKIRRIKVHSEPCACFKNHKRLLKRRWLEFCHLCRRDLFTYTTSTDCIPSCIFWSHKYAKMAYNLINLNPTVWKYNPHLRKESLSIWKRPNLLLLLLVLLLSLACQLVYSFVSEHSKFTIWTQLFCSIISLSTVSSFTEGLFNKWVSNVCEEF